jgi:hypothetical protein
MDRGAGGSQPATRGFGYAPACSTAKQGSGVGFAAEKLLQNAALRHWCRLRDALFGSLAFDLRRTGRDFGYLCLGSTLVQVLCASGFATCCGALPRYLPAAALSPLRTIARADITVEQPPAPVLLFAKEAAGDAGQRAALRRCTCATVFHICVRGQIAYCSSAL